MLNWDHGHGRLSFGERCASEYNNRRHNVCPPLLLLVPSSRGREHNARTRTHTNTPFSTAKLSSGGCTHCTAVHNVQSSSIESLDLWWWWWWWWGLSHTFQLKDGRVRLTLHTAALLFKDQLVMQEWLLPSSSSSSIYSKQINALTFRFVIIIVTMMGGMERRGDGEMMSRFKAFF